MKTSAFSRFRRKTAIAISSTFIALSLPSLPANANGLGGYAVIHPDGHVCGVIVGNSYFAGNDRTMTSEYMGCPVGSRIIFQTKPSPSGNVAGWHGTDVTYSNGTFRLASGTTITNGIATDPNGRVWDTGSGETITPAPSSGSGTGPAGPETNTATTNPETSTSNSEPPVSTPSTPFETPTSSAGVNTTTSSQPASSGSTSDSNGTSGSSAPTTNPTTSPATNAETSTSSSATNSGISASPTPAVESPVAEVNDDGVEEDPVGDVITRRLDDGRYRLAVRTNLESEQVIIRATKRGMKTVRFQVTLNENGRAVVITSRDLSGFRVSLLFGDLVLDAKRLV